MEGILYHPIGRISSPFKDNVGVPRQAVGAADVRAKIEVFNEFSKGLKDLDGFSHIVVVFHLHLVTSPSLAAHPPWDGREHGVFATRSPYRPNPIGISTVRLERIHDNILEVSGVDMIDGTPVLDIKPYVPDLNPAGEVKTGWLPDTKAERMVRSRSGDR
ncbi:MAG: tRNA (N6-threonylcarbamoyladenosine(37)-N6)-methyltransferase TrmO [Sedimentisphaerales bacterium]|nr:tRNA (N6-threonylcarbamoyladenosine(37)-N6)-methyltransferase TrmO [Sedimentisphaerales bacterium]